jgi:intein/homing endonuclease
MSILYKKPKIFIWCDTPTVPTGFGVVAKNLFRDLHKKFEVEILGINYHGDMKYDTDKWFIYTAAQGPDALGFRKLKKLLPRVKPDVVLMFQDIFHINDAWSIVKGGAPDAKILIYFPIDGTPVNVAWERPLREADTVVTYTEFAKQALFDTFPHLRKRKIYTLGHGIDFNSYRPLSETEIRNTRRELGWENKFAIINVNRFQPRKLIPMTLRAVALFTKGYHKCKCGNWYLKGRRICDLNGCSRKDIIGTVKGRSDTLLYLHMVPNEPGMGPGHANSLQAHAYNAGYRDEDLQGSKQCLQINAVDIYSNPFSEEILNGLYNAACVNISTTVGEGWGLCIQPTVFITLRTGAKQVKDIMPGDEVLAQDGHFHKVKNIWTNKRPLLEFKIRGTIPIKVSKEHPFLVYRTSKTVGRLRSSRLDIENELKWVKAEQLKKGDLVAYPKPKLNAPLPKRIDLTEWIDFNQSNLGFDDSKVWLKMDYSPKDIIDSYTALTKELNETKKVIEVARRHLKRGTVPKSNTRARRAYDSLRARNFIPKSPVKINRYINVTEDFLYFVGWYIAEGSNANGTCVEFSLSGDEIRVAEKLNKIGQKLFGITGKIFKKKTSSVCSLVFCSSILAQFFEKLCGHHAENKFIHPIFFDSAESIGRLLCGYVLGDGHIYKKQNRIQMTTSSVNLAWQLRTIFAAKGIYSQIRKRKFQKAWNVEMGGYDRALFYDWVGIGRPLKKNRSLSNFSLKTKNYILVPIREINKLPGNHLVYDLEVEKSHSFVGNGILLHNSLSEASASGTPTIAPKQSAVPEVLGNTGHLIPNVAHFNMALDNAHVRPLVDVRKIIDALELEYQKWLKNKRQPVKDQKIIDRTKKVCNWDDKRAFIEKAIEDLLISNKNVNLLTGGKFVRTNPEKDADR